MSAPNHLTDISSLSDRDFYHLLDRSLAFRRIMDEGASPRPTLQHRLQFNLFYENSTRTNLSFEV
ncbi:MAG: aspartate carbamoyltransferase, partial [Pseudomonadota bacterium]